jgi:hypothetical protein
VSDRPGHIVWASYDAMPPEARVYCDPGDGHYKRNVPKPLGGADLNGERIVVFETEARPVARSPEEAKAHRRDYFHPVECPCGQSFETWIRDGRKPERERTENLGQVVLEQSPAPRHMSVRDFQAAGGCWPPPRSLWDDVYDLQERRNELEREVRFADARRDLANAFGWPHDAVDADERRHRGELKRIIRALAGITTSTRGPMPREVSYSDDEFTGYLKEATSLLLGRADVTERMVVLRMPMQRTAFRAGLERLRLRWPVLRERIRRGGPIL